MDTKEFITGLVLILGVLVLVGIICYASYMDRVMKYDNFQKTITGLNDDQKCLHICGFQYPDSTYFDNYKYCVEKCDRISERATG